jgi:hypothetical protein
VEEAGQLDRRDLAGAQSLGLIVGQVAGQALGGNLDRGVDDGVEGDRTQRWVMGIPVRHFAAPF